MIYALLQLQRVIGFKGVEHLWEILLSRETVFIELLTYVPLAIGVLLALVQFVPEIQQKRLKLTLHLPYPQRSMIGLMLAAGLVQLGIIFVLNYLTLWAYLQSILAPELVARILLTSLPWYLCGITGYLFAAWICLEPTWRRRIIDLLIAVGVVRIFFLSSVPEAYNCFFALARGVHGGGDAAAPTFGVPFQGGMPGLIRRRCCRALKRLLLLKRF